MLLKLHLKPLINKNNMIDAMKIVCKVCMRKLTTPILVAYGGLAVPLALLAFL